VAIRIRTVNGVTVALCAVESDERQGDIYLDDGAHHALSTKFGLDFHSMGYLDNPRADPLVVEVMATQKVRDAEEEHNLWERERNACRRGGAATIEIIKILWGGLLCFAGIHDGAPDGDWLTCDRCGDKMPMSRIIPLGADARKQAKEYRDRESV